MSYEQLSAFISVANTGSFTESAKSAFITPTAMAKKITALENSLDVQLFERSSHGLKLTEAGKIFYQDAKYIIRYCDESIARIKAYKQSEIKFIRVGSSPMTPVSMARNFYNKIGIIHPEFRFQVVPFANSKDTSHEILSTLGKNIDVLCAVFDDALLSTHDCCGLELTRLPLQCAMSIHHPLAEKEKLSIADFYGEHVLLLQRGRSSSVDSIRTELEIHPQIFIHDFDLYDADTFSLCESANYLIISMPGWQGIHPMLKFAPVDWDYGISFGLLHAFDPEPQVQVFLDAATHLGDDWIYD